MPKQGRRPPQPGERQQWPPGVSRLAWATLVAGGITLFFGVAGLLVGSVQLFPGLASTIYLQAAAPEQPSARLYNVIVAHFIALLAGYLAVIAFGLTTAPSALSIHALSAPRVYATTIAMAVTVAGSLAARASHPPAATTAFLISLGTIPATVRDAVAIAVAVVVVGAVGEIFRRLRLRGSLRGSFRE